MISSDELIKALIVWHDARQAVFDVFNSDTYKTGKLTAAKEVGLLANAEWDLHRLAKKKKEELNETIL